MPCQGLFDRKYEVLYDDGNAGATTAQKLWTDKRQKASDGIICTSDNQKVVVICDCCTRYTEWSYQPVIIFNQHKNTTYHLATYKEFLDEMKEACQKGDNDSKTMIDSLAPQMAATLKEGKQWEVPDVPLEGIPENMHIISSKEDVNIVMDDFISDAITKELGVSGPGTESYSPDNSIPDDSNQALANYLVDITPSTVDKDQSLPYKGKVFDSKGEQIRAITLLKGLQPHREVPNKNRGKRFAAGEIVSDKPLHVLYR